MDIISAIFSAISTAVTQFTSALGGAFTGVTALFYTPGSGSDPGSLTVLGVLFCIGAGVGLVYTAWRIIAGLIQRA